MKTFKIGEKFTSHCPWTGGAASYEVETIRKTSTKQIACKVFRHELDGEHKDTEVFEVHTDEQGNEYIVLWTIGEHEGRYYAEEE